MNVPNFGAIIRSFLCFVIFSAISPLAPAFFIGCDAGEQKASYKSIYREGICLIMALPRSFFYLLFFGVNLAADLTYLHYFAALCKMQL